MVYCISYDLKSPGRDYSSLYEAIKSYGRWWHQTESVWLIVTDESVVSVRDRLMERMDSNDKLFVIALQNVWAGVGFQEREYNWLKSIPEAYWK